MISNRPDAFTSADDEQYDALIEQIAEQLEAGELVDLEAKIAQHPQYADQLRRALPTMRAMFDLGMETASGTGKAKTDSQPIKGMLGDYQILREIGRGGMGVVYEAEQISLGRRVALKVLPFASMLDRRHRQRFQNEARAAATLEHPNVVPVYGVGQDRGVHYYAMKLIHGQSLVEVLTQLRQEAEPETNNATATPPVSDLTEPKIASRDGGEDAGDEDTVQLPPGDAADAPAAGEGRQREAASIQPVAGLSTERSQRRSAYYRRVAEIGIQAARALAHAHELGITHRDIKPGNLLLDEEGNCWVTDFGLAHVESDVTLTRTGDMVGTLRYMSPEQAQGDSGVVGSRADVYGLGITLYELLTLRPAFRTADRVQLLREILEEDLTPPRQINPAIPRDLETIVLKATAKEPSRRYRTAGELGDDLQRVLDDEPIRAKRATLLARARKWTKRHRTLTATVAVATMALMVTAGAAAWQDMQTRRETVQAVREDLAAAEAAIAAEDYELAQKELFEALARGPAQPLLSTIRQRQNSLERFERFITLADQARMSWDVTMQENAADALAVYHVLETSEWKTSFEQLSTKQQEQIESSVYELLVLLAHFELLKGAGPRAALTHLEKAADGCEPTPVFYQVRARAYRRLGDTSAANRDAKLAQTVTPSLALDHYLPGRYAAWAGRKEEAFAHYTRALRLDPQHYPTLFFITLHITDKADELPEALIGYLACSIVRPNDWLLCNNRAHVYARHGVYDEAMVEVQRALALAHSNSRSAQSQKQVLGRVSQACVLIAKGLLEQGEQERAESVYEKAVELGKDDAGLLVTIGGSFAKQGKLKRAKSLLKQALEVDADCERALNNLAWMAVAHPDAKLVSVDQAVEHAETAVENEPKEGGYWNTLGAVKCRAGDYEGAVTALNKSVQLRSGGDSFDFLFLAMAHDQLDNSSDARRWYRRAVGWMEKNAAEDAELIQFRSEAEALLGFTPKDRVEQVNEYEAQRRLGAEPLIRPDAAEASWRRAAAWYVREVPFSERNGKELMHWMAHLAQTDREAWRLACGRLLAAYGDTVDPFAAYSVAWTCKLAPRASEEYASLLKLAKAGTWRDDEVPPILYRAGRYQEAYEHITVHWSARLEQGTRKWWICVWLAMIHAKVDKPAEAKKWLAKVHAFVEERDHEQLPRELTVLYEEAQEVVTGRSKATTKASDRSVQKTATP